MRTEEPTYRRSETKIVESAVSLSSRAVAARMEGHNP